MNTTNLITDYIIAGIIGLICLFLPLLMISYPDMSKLINTEIKNPTFWALLITAIAYGWGVVFNQLADRAEELAYWVFGCHDEVDKFESNLKRDTGLKQHQALQYVVFHSTTGYDYISFRRTMIRILRAFLCTCFLLPIIHLFWVEMFMIFGGINLKFSWVNLVTCIISLYLSYLLVLGLLKLQKGYYGALTNFVKVIKDDKGHKIRL